MRQIAYVASLRRARPLKGASRVLVPTETASAVVRFVIKVDARRVAKRARPQLEFSLPERARRATRRTFGVVIARGQTLLTSRPLAARALRLRQIVANHSAEPTVGAVIGSLVRTDKPIVISAADVVVVNPEYGSALTEPRGQSRCVVGVGEQGARAAVTPRTAAR